jgi:hypothetical protein
MPDGSVDTALTVTLNEQEELPHAFEAVHVTKVVPCANVLPDAGRQFTVGEVPDAPGVE